MASAAPSTNLCGWGQLHPSPQHHQHLTFRSRNPLHCEEAFRKEDFRLESRFPSRPHRVLPA